MLAYSVLAVVGALTAAASPVDTSALEPRQTLADDHYIIPGLGCGSSPAPRLGVNAATPTYGITDGETLYPQIPVKFFVDSWTLPATGQGQIKMTSDGITKCIDAGSNPANGVQVKIWECYDNLPQQQWKIHDNKIELVGYNLCFDLKDGILNLGVIQTWECADGNPNQMFYTSSLSM